MTLVYLFANAFPLLFLTLFFCLSVPTARLMSAILMHYARPFSFRYFSTPAMSLRLSTLNDLQWQL